MADAAVAILTWRGEEMARSCLDSLRERGLWTGPTLIVDNGSGTGEGERLAAEFGVDHISLPSNGGVAVGYNAAITWARDRGLSHILLANNDLEFTEQHLATKLTSIAGPDVAAVAPVVRMPNGPVWSAGVRLRRRVGHAQRLHSSLAQHPYEVDALDGSCVLVSIEAACKVGGLAPEYFLYWEETDWCERARRAGLRILVDPTTSVTHVGMGSGNLRETRRYALRNSLLFIRRTQRGSVQATASLLWLVGRAPMFVVRRLLERASPVAVLADLVWAFRWHVADIRAHGWKREPDGPAVCG